MECEVMEGQVKELTYMVSKVPGVKVTFRVVEHDH
jgi:hypothetical protein